MPVIQHWGSLLNKGRFFFVCVCVCGGGGAAGIKKKIVRFLLGWEKICWPDIVKRKKTSEEKKSLLEEKKCFVKLNQIDYLAPQIRSMNNRLHSEAKLPW